MLERSDEATVKRYTLDRQIEAAARHVTALRQHAGPAAHHNPQLEKVLAQVSEAVEELRLTATDLCQQSAELAAARESLEAERVQTAQALRENEARTQAILNTAVDGIITIDKQGTIQSFNRAAERVFGYSAAEVLGQNITMLAPSPYRQEHDRYIADYIKTGQSKIIGIGRQVLGLRKDGSTFPMDLAVSEWEGGGQRMFTGIVRDISRRKRAEQDLAVQYGVTRVLAESTTLSEVSPRLLCAIGEGVGWELGELWFVDPETKLLRRGGVWHAPGTEASDFEVTRREMAFAPRQGLLGRVWAEGQPVWMADVTEGPCFVRAQTATKVRLRGTFAFPIRSSGTVIGVVVFFSSQTRQPDPALLQMLEALGTQIGDFIARKRAEEAIRESEARFHAFMDNSPAVGFMKDEAGRYVYVNATFERFFEVRRADTIGKTDFDIFPADVARRLRQNDQAVLRENATMELSESVPSADGCAREWLVFKFPVTDAKGRRFVGGKAVDITERKRAEADLRELQKLARQRERLADVGAITAQIVHDLGNPLAGLSMQAQLIMRRIRRGGNEPVSTVLKPVEQIVSEVRRLDSLIKDFMNFSRGQHLDLQPLPLHPFLQAVVEFWGPVATERGIPLNLALPPEAPVLNADADQLRRVFDNLLKNAVEAIGQGPGRIDITVAVPTAEMVRISLQDSGPGIASSVQVFRLFETTKGSGSGLGLAITKQIVLAHGGGIDFAHVEPHGTVFHIELPRSSGSVSTH